MKLAELLILRADLQKRIQQMRVRLINNSKVQEGESPDENPIELLKELDRDIVNLESLIKVINKTNNSTIIDGVSISDMIAKKDSLSLKISVIRELVNSASEKLNRYSNMEIKVLSTVDIAEQRKLLDLLSKELRELDTKLQYCNWITDVETNLNI